MVPPEVIAQRYAQHRQNVVGVRGREQGLLLLIFIVNLQLGGVAIHIAGVVIGILGYPLGSETLVQALLPSPLHKGVMVSLTLTPSPHIIDNSARDASL